jgi:hypothetical protein
VLSRIFPVKRGLYEDYVSNFWCASSVVYKWREMLEGPLLLRVAAGATLSVAAPALLHQVVRPSPHGLLLCMANSAFAFYMFSYQVGWGELWPYAVACHALRNTWAVCKSHIPSRSPSQAGSRLLQIDIYVHVRTHPP